MIYKKEVEYNKKTFKQFGLEPWMFGGSAGFDDILIEKIKDFQRKYNIEADGMVGPGTHRRLMTEMEAFPKPKLNRIYCNNNSIPIDTKVINHKDYNGFVAPSETYISKWFERKPRLIVVHFDVCLSSKSCFEVLKQRKLSAHFLIDNDGTIYQTMDTNHVGQHAPPVNQDSIGIEISNAFYTKFSKTYTDRGFPMRPIINNSVIHGQKIEPHLGFYPEQIEALKSLLSVLTRVYNIPKVTPVDKNGKQINTEVPQILDKNYKGIVHHFQITKNKIDACGIDLPELLKDI